MDILDFFGLGSDKPSPKKIHRAVKTLTHKYVDAGKRWAAAEQLGQWGTPEALFGLLQRFTMNAPSATVDDDEKKGVCDLLCSMGDKVIGPILKFLREKDEVNWPLTALDRLVAEPALVGHLLDILGATEITFARNSSKKVEILNRLKGVADERIPGGVVRFLDDTDDEVVLVALDILAESANEELRDKLWEKILAERDRPRVQLKILEVFAHKGWKARGGADKAEIKQLLPKEFYVTKKGLVKKSP